MHRKLPTWRSLLYVPVTSSRFVAHAADRGADAIILDLEDSVAPASRDAARRLVPDAAREVARNGAGVLARVNRPWRLLVRDLEAAVGPWLEALVLPKVESAEHLEAVGEVVDELEAAQGLRPGSVSFFAFVETARGLQRLEAIARHPRLVALAIGSDDLALSLGMRPDDESLLPFKLQGVVAARAAGILPLGLLRSHADFRDLDGFRTLVQRSRDLGYMGATCVHPSQVPIANEAFAPTDDEIDAAQRMVAAYRAALAAGVGASVHEGRMIDVPIVRRAHAVLDRARACGRDVGAVFGSELFGSASGAE